MSKARQYVGELVEIADLADQLARSPAASDPAVRDIADEFGRLIERRLERSHHSITKTAAAAVLGLTDETVTAWVRRGILQRGEDPTTPKETIDFNSVLEVRRRIERLRACGVTDKAAWAKLLAAGLGEGGEPFSTEDLQIIELNRHSRGRGLVLPDLHFGRSAS